MSKHTFPHLCTKTRDLYHHCRVLSPAKLSALTVVQRTAHRKNIGVCQVWGSLDLECLSNQFGSVQDLGALRTSVQSHFSKLPHNEVQLLRVQSGPVNALGRRANLQVPHRRYDLATTSSTLLRRCGLPLRRCTVFFALGAGLWTLFRLPRPECLYSFTR